MKRIIERGKKFNTSEKAPNLLYIYEDSSFQYILNCSNNVRPSVWQYENHDFNDVNESKWPEHFEVNHIQILTNIMS